MRNDRVLAEPAHLVLFIVLEVALEPPTRSRISQIKTSFDPFNADVHPIKAIRHAGILVFKIADALLYLTNVVAHVIDRATNMAQMLKNDAFRFSHAMKLSRRQSIVNYAWRE